MKPNLKIIGENTPKQLPPIDTKGPDHWAKVHIAGDRAKPLPTWWGMK
jgi:hypothetical protein